MLKVCDIDHVDLGPNKILSYGFSILLSVDLQVIEWFYNNCRMILLLFSILIMEIEGFWLLKHVFAKAENVARTVAHTYHGKGYTVTSQNLGLALRCVIIQ